MSVDTEGPVLFYGGNFGYCFCNFSAFQVNYHGVIWMTSEHAYQASKFHGSDYDTYDKIFRARSAYEAWKIAGTHADKIRGDWDEPVKLAVMADIVSHKHDQHEHIQRKLQETGSRKIVEDSPIDSFWGRGPDGNGRNELGKIWMRLRKERYGI